MSRVDLWLSWNYILGSSAVDLNPTVAEYHTGFDRFQDVKDSTQADTIVQDADGTCGLGRSGHEITGW